MLPSGRKRRLRYETEALSRNSKPEFVGYSGLKKVHQSGPEGASRTVGHLDAFEKWASSGVRIFITCAVLTEARHGRTSRQVITSIEASSHGYEYTVFKEDIAQLLTDQEWVHNHRRGIQLVALAWGWDIVKAQPVALAGTHQHWHAYPIRLYKCALSAWLFGYADYFASLRLFALRVRQLHGPSTLDSYIVELFDLDAKTSK